MPVPRQYLALMSTDNSPSSTTRKADSAVNSLGLLSLSSLSSCMIRHSLAAECFNRILGEMGARTGVGLSGPNPYLSDGKSVCADQMVNSPGRQSEGG